jgi:hypothetical protein
MIAEATEKQNDLQQILKIAMQSAHTIKAHTIQQPHKSLQTFCAQIKQD